jgi:hypothetical protein
MSNQEMTETLTDRAERLRQTVARPTEKEQAQAELTEVERQIAAHEAAVLQAEAKDRVLGIVRALGSLIDESASDDRRLNKTADAFRKAAEAVNERFNRIILLKHEAVTLAETFGLKSPELPTVTPPSHRADVTDAIAAVRVVANADRGVTPILRWEKDAQGRLCPVGRSFDELDGTPGVELIRRATKQA